MRLFLSLSIGHACILICLCFSAINCFISNEDKLLLKKYKKMIRFATKTPYRLSRPLQVSPFNQFKKFNAEDFSDPESVKELIKLPGNEYDKKKYTPVKFWGLVRHATRYPSKETILNYQNMTVLRDEILQRKSELQFTPEQIKDFEDWMPFMMDPIYEKRLANEGILEALQFAGRLKTRFPQVLNMSKTCQVRFTPTERAETTAIRFLDSLDIKFEKRQAIQVARDDPVLRPYKQCPLWKKEVKKNPESLREKWLFKNTDKVKNMINEIREMLKIDYLTFEDIELMYKVCAYETAWRHNPKHPWCHVFDAEKFEIMEFLEDLEYYYIDGYGHPITSKICCHTAEDLLNSLDPHADSPNLNFMFTHSGTILKFLAFMDLHKDSFKLTHNHFNFERKWKTSRIDPFLANIIFVLLESIQNPGKYSVLLMHNEDVMEIPGIEYKEDSLYKLARWRDFKNLMKKKIEKCDLKSLCKLKVEEVTHEKKDEL